MIHIVFNAADVKVLQEAIALDETLQGDVIQIQDDYAVGPLTNIYLGEGKQQRKRWWHHVQVGGDYDENIETETIDDYKTIATLVGTLRRDETEVIWIWAAQNKHDVSGYYWLLNYMKEFQSRVFILYLNNLPFINEKGNIFYPDWLFQIPAKEFLKAKKLAREITASEFEVDPDEWIKICEENKGVRILERGKKLVQFDYDYYDAELKKHVTAEWQKASKIINNFLNKAKNTTGDVYLLWRLKTLAAMQILEMQRGVKNDKDLEFKLVN
ncbi:MAG: DUF3658 domain-containing protein [Ferruginibacter sp.]|nr:DUF1835 domain-containing protein [Ferruginibacter sp.]